MTNTDEYDGSSWTAVTAMPFGRGEHGSFGVLTAGVNFGGVTTGALVTSFEYDGTNWANGGNMPEAKRGEPGGAGTLTAGLACGGGNPRSVKTFEYDGTSWSEAGNLATAITNVGSAQNGTQTDAMIFGGNISSPAPTVATTEGYDGTSWSTRPSLATARKLAGGAGTGTLALTFGGQPGALANTEEFTGDVAVATAKTVDFD